MTSLRRRLIIITAGACAGCFLVTGIGLYLSLRASLIREFDRTLLTRADAIVAATEHENGQVKLELEDVTITTATTTAQTARAPNRRAEFFQIWTEDSREIIRSPALGAQQQQQQLDFPRTAADGSGEFVALPDGSGEGRRIVRRFAPRGEDKTSAPPALVLSLVVGSTDLQRELASVAWQIGIVFGIATLVAAAAMGVAITVGLRPVGALATRIASQRDQDLTRPIETASVPPELSPVVLRLNELLDRIGASIEREKQFTADVAHELRTPIGGLDAALEVCLTRPREPEEYRRVLLRCRQTTQQMHRLVETILLLARAENHQLSATRQSIALHPFILECWQPFASRAALGNRRVQWNMDESATLESDPTLLRIVLATLFDNALSHGDAGGWIEIDVLERPSATTVLRIRNSGCTMDAETVKQVFERFWQHDAARSSNGDHAGLGLSLCRKIMPLLNGQIIAQVPQPGVFQIELHFTAQPIKPAAMRSAATGDCVPLASAGTMPA